MSYQLHIKVLEATKLPKMDVFSKSDPYVVLSIDGTQKKKTRTKKNTLNPRWNEEFHLTANDIARQTLVLNMYDEDLNADDHMGSLEIVLSSLPFGQVLDQWYDMIPAKKVKKAGRIHLTLHLAPMGAPPFVSLPNQSGMMPGAMQPGMMQPGMMPGVMQPGMMQSGMMQPGMMPGVMQPGMMQPGMMQPGMMQPGMMPGVMQPGMMQPGMMQPGMGNFQSAMMGMANVGNSMMTAVPGSGSGLQPGMGSQYCVQPGQMQQGMPGQMQQPYGQQNMPYQQYPGQQQYPPQQYPNQQQQQTRPGSNQYPGVQSYPGSQPYPTSQQQYPNQQKQQPQVGYTQQQLNSSPNPYEGL